MGAEVMRGPRKARGPSRRPPPSLSPQTGHPLPPLPQSHLCPQRGAFRGPLCQGDAGGIAVAGGRQHLQPQRSVCDSPLLCVPGRVSRRGVQAGCPAGRSQGPLGAAAPAHPRLALSSPLSLSSRAGDPSRAQLRGNPTLNRSLQGLVQRGPEPRGTAPSSQQVSSPCNVLCLGVPSPR